MGQTVTREPQPTIVEPPKKRGRSSLVRSQARTAWLLLIPTLVVVAAVVWCAFHVLMPLRQLVISENVLWDEAGMRFSWRVMVREKSGTLTYRVTLPEGRVVEVSPYDTLTHRQVNEMIGQPDLILQLAHHIRDDYAKRGVHVEVRADARDWRPGVRRGELHQLVDGADPEIAVRARLDAGHQAEIGDADDPPRNQPVESLGGTCPEIAVAILHQRHDPVARQPGQFDRALDGVVGAAAADPPQPLPERAHPQIVVAVVEHGVAAAASKRQPSAGSTRS